MTDLEVYYDRQLLIILELMQESVGVCRKVSKIVLNTIEYAKTNIEMKKNNLQAMVKATSLLALLVETNHIGNLSKLRTKELDLPSNHQSTKYKANEQQ